MKLTRKLIACVALTLTMFIIVVVSCISQAGSTKDTLPLQPQGEPIKVGVCMPSGGPLATLALNQADGIRAAFKFAASAGGRPIDILFKDPGNSPQEFGKVVEELIETDKVSAVIACVSPETASGSHDILKARKVPLIITSPSASPRENEVDQNYISIFTKLEDQANACARFAISTLKARRMGIVLDVGDVSCVRLVSLFSSHIVKNGVRIVDVIYLKRDGDFSSALTRLMGEKPDAIYIPFSSSVPLPLIAKMKAMNSKVQIMVSNVQKEEDLLSEAGGSLESVYILTDFHEQTVRSSRGKNFIEFYHKKLKKRYLSSSIAMGADAYFLAVDMVMNPLDSKAQGLSWDASILGITGATPTGALRTQLNVGRLNKVFLHGPTLEYFGQVVVSDLNPGTDVRTQ
jgi:branched-chain amino acid transport system substrate-binding protein